MTNQIKLKRAYSPESPQDGRRILVDRLWPRGESKTKADLYKWEKQIAPSDELRKRLHEGTLSWPEFEAEYFAQLNSNPKAASFLSEVRDLLKTEDVTLLFASKDEDHNNGVVLKDWLEKNLLHPD